MLKRMTTIVIGPNDKISGSVMVSAPPAPTSDTPDLSEQDVDDQTEQENT